MTEQQDRALRPSNAQDDCYRVGFLLLSNYSMASVSSAIEILCVANQLSSNRLYQWQVLSSDGEGVCAANGLGIHADQSVADVDLTTLDVIIVCENGPSSEDRKLIGWLKQANRHKVKLGAFGTGSLLLARAGLLDGYRSAIHWDYLVSMRELFPKIKVSPTLFVIDRDRFTCCGGNSSQDLMLEIITRRQGVELASAISEQVVYERVRGQEEVQRIPLRSQLGNAQPKLTEALTLMEANIEEPMKVRDLAGYVGVSSRQLERIFQKFLNISPSRYYLELRLTRARQLLVQTDKSIVEIAIASGFVSPPRFSVSFREYFGICPRDARKAFLLNGDANLEQNGLLS